MPSALVANSATASGTADVQPNEYRSLVATREATSSPASGPRRRCVTCGRPAAQAMGDLSVGLGRYEIASSTGMEDSARPIVSRRSSDSASIQWQSSSTSTSGDWTARRLSTPRRSDRRSSARSSGSSGLVRALSGIDTRTAGANSGSRGTRRGSSAARLRSSLARSVAEATGSPGSSPNIARQIACHGR